MPVHDAVGIGLGFTVERDANNPLLGLKGRCLGRIELGIVNAGNAVFGRAAIDKSAGEDARVLDRIGRGLCLQVGVFLIAVVKYGCKGRVAQFKVLPAAGVDDEAAQACCRDG